MNRVAIRDQAHVKDTTKKDKGKVVSGGKTKESEVVEIEEENSRVHKSFSIVMVNGEGCIDEA